MWSTKRIIIKCITALTISIAMATTLVAFATTGSVNTIVIEDGEQTQKISTFCSAAEEILTEAKISLEPGDSYTFNLNNGQGTLAISRSFPVYITVGKDMLATRMPTGTVRQALALVDITLDEYDLCSMNPDDILREEAYIDILNVQYKTVSHEETVPYTTKVEYSGALSKGKQTSVAGKNGIKTVTMRQKLVNGVLTEEQVVSETVTTAAVAAKTIIGTKTSATPAQVAARKAVSTLKPASTLALDANGKPVSYSKSMTFKASAYTSGSGAKCSTGVTPQPGYIAVNPKIIPYGTKMYIVSNDGKYVYGYAIAADTGGFARNNPYMVDLYFNSKSACRNFGIRNVTIYFLN